MNEIELIDINLIKASAVNPRKINKAGLDKMIKSIQEFPEMLNLRCIVVDENMEIIGGNQRFLACKTIGMKQVPIIRAEGLTAEQKKEFLIKDNVHFGEFDIKGLEDFKVDTGILSDWGVDVKLNTEIEKNDKSSMRGSSYNDEDLPEIEPYKLAYRLTSSCKVKNNKSIELFGGRKALTFWYSKVFKSVITCDIQKFEGVNHDYYMSALNFIKYELKNHLDFNYIDFDDEGCPMKEVQEFFKIIKGKKKDPFVLAITDGQGLNLKCMGKINFFTTYMIRENETVQATQKDYYGFNEIFREAINTIVVKYGFSCKELSLHRKENGNVIYSTYLINTIDQTLIINNNAITRNAE